MNRFIRVNREIEKGVVNGYKATRQCVVTGYKAVEKSVVGAYKNIEDAFVESFLTPVDSPAATEKAKENEDERNN